MSVRHVVMWTLKNPADAPRFKELLDKKRAELDAQRARALSAILLSRRRWRRFMQPIVAASVAVATSCDSARLPRPATTPTPWRATSEKWARKTRVASRPAFSIRSSEGILCPSMAQLSIARISSALTSFMPSSFLVRARI